MKKSLIALSCLFSMLFVGNKTEANAEVFQQTFETTTGNWQEIVGTTDLTSQDNQLNISNTTQGSSVESVALLKDSPILQDGEVEVDFLYEGQKNFSVIFRGSESEKWNWQTVAYNGDGKWTIGQPGGKWLSNIDGPTLVSGTTYRLLVCYEGESLSVYVNNECFYNNDQVTYPDDKGTISSEWTGKVGIRLFGNRTTLKINSIKNGPIGSLNESEAMKEDYKNMRQKWRENVVGNFDVSPELESDTQIKAYIDKLSSDAEVLYSALNKESTRTTLWEKLTSDTNSANLTTQFKKLNTLAKAYGTKGSTLYKNQEVLQEIVSGFDFMIQEGLYSGKNYYGNWWDWQIGVTQEFVTALIIISDDIPQELIDKYVAVLSNYLVDPYQQLSTVSQTSASTIKFINNFKNSGANRTDQALSFLGMGLLTNNAGTIQSAVSSISEVFAIVKSGDGFYADGSFIQHSNIPYSGSYGSVLVKGVGKIFSIVSDTRWEAAESIRAQFVQTVKDAFLPLVVNGETMSFVNGRSIARAPAATKNGFGSATLYNLLITAEFADDANKSILQQAAKYWMVQNEDYYLTNTREFKDLLLTKQVLANQAIDTANKPFTGSHVYGAMDRFVYGDEAINLGISMYSTRTSAFEAINKENKKGWHTADGMVYLYNSDQQFGSEYWPTVDWYRLPGTTVDTRELLDETTFKSFKSSEKYVGGVTDGQESVVSMQLNKAGTYNGGQEITMDLKAKKSWFVFDGKIISLGSDINGTTDKTIETVIENRLLDASSTYTFTDQNNQDASTTDSHSVNTSNWLLLNSSKENQSIGYVMLDNQTIKTEKETRTGTYKTINDPFPSDTIYTGTYQKVLVEHGKEVSDGSYAYVTYPNATAEQLNEVVANKEFNVLSNNASIQAVSNQQKQQIGATFWDTVGGEIEGIKVNKSVSLLYKEETKNQVHLSVANPNQTNEIVTITLPRKIIETIDADTGVTVAGNTITVDTSNAAGKSFNVTLKVQSTEVEEDVPVENVKVTENSLVILSKGKTLATQVDILPENATNKSLKWEVANSAVAEVKEGKILAKKAGTTKITVTSVNGKKDSFTLRVTN